MENLDRFKFKWFDKGIKFMADVNLLDVKDDYAVVSYSYADEYTPDEEIKLSDGILIQCTGLKDKNDKLIFEGDIITITFDDGSQTLFGKIVWNKMTASFGIASAGDTNIQRIEYDILESAEVIGNIYENEDLAKEHNLIENRVYYPN